MNIQRITLQQASLGEIYQHILIALEKLCNQIKFLSEMEKVHNKLKDNCKRSHFKKYPLRKKYHAELKKRFFRKRKWKHKGVCLYQSQFSISLSSPPP